MKHPSFRTHIVPVSATPDSVFVLTETSEETYSSNDPALAKYMTHARPDGRAETALWFAAGLDPKQAARRLRNARVSVRMLCGMRAGDLKRMLRAVGILVGTPPSLEIAVADDYLDPRLAGPRQWPVLLVKPLGRTVWVGPVVGPGAACWACLAASLRENRPLETQLKRLGEVPPVWRAALASTVDLAYGMAVTQASLWIAEPGCGIDHRLIALDTLTGSAESHPVRRRPDCEVCGSAAGRGPRVRLMARRKVEGHRTATLDQTRRRLQDLVSPVTGIIRSIQVIPNQYQPLIQIAAASYNLPLACLHRQAALVGRPEGGSGKGTSIAAAEVSAIAEALERYCGIFRGGERRVRATMAELDAPAFSPDQLLCFSPEQYRVRARWNRRCRPIERVPEPFDPCTAIDWTPVWSLTHAAVRYLPTAFCYFHYPEPAPYCQADSNGCAAGNTLEEAILQGFYELAERDAVALWWYPRARRPGVDLAACDLPAVDALRRNGRVVAVLDLTTDLGVPVYAAITADSRGGAIAIGLAAHLDPRAAIASAVVDAAWQEAVAGHPAANVHRATRRWLRTQRLAGHAYLRPHGRAPERANLAGRDVRGDLRTCVQAAERVGIEVLVLDQTRAETGIAVARVIAPGLRHLWPRFGPGRMPRPRGGMNPVPFPF